MADIYSAIAEMWENTELVTFIRNNDLDSFINTMAIGRALSITGRIACNIKSIILSTEY